MYCTFSTRLDGESDEKTKAWHDPRTACWAKGPGRVVWEGR